MKPGAQPTDAERMLIAQLSGLARHRDTDHPDRWPDVIAHMRALTRDPVLLAHADDGRPTTAQLLEQAGADMAEVARIRARPKWSSGLGGMADRAQREIRTQQ